MDLTENDLFERYWANRSIANRNAIVEKYAYIVPLNVSQMTLPDRSCLQTEDYYASGTIGLIEAVERYEDGHGIKFATFAKMRIVGSILDEIRNVDWVPRLDRMKERRGEAVPVPMVFGSKVKWDGVPCERPAAHTACEFWEHVTQGMTQRESAIVLSYYRDGMTMRDIGHQVGLSVSNVCRLLSAIIPRLRSRLQ